MTDNTIRWGIIGCGDVTEVKSGPAFNKVPHSKLVAVMRRNAEKAADYARRHGVERWYSDAEQLINDPEVNAIYVATPPLQHEEYTIAALRAGKPVYVEKPMAIHADAAARMAQAALDTGVKLTVAHYRRAQPLFLKVKSLLEEGAIGVPRLVNLYCLQPHRDNKIASTEDPWRYHPAISGGGLFYDLAPHQLDLMLYFLGTPEKVSGLSVNASKLYGADDTTIGQALFPNNVLFNGTWSFTVPEKRDHCEIIGTGGSLQFSIFDHRLLVLKQGDREQQFAFDPLPHVQQPMIQKVVDYFLNRGDNPCSADEGVTVMQMIDAMAGGEW
ncbi:Gfo/Idh/MocA family protein [Flavisolibacter tropicus]|uniref:Oxidoreductase n=1 Tax=Flavisolibacter tropicus TaxID=1492898 RepID=A0A172TWZ3_9BACT|nr:Gfo/Idh/MocA family oxidoreductase [Flavisolibacter tropicus]ANE51526.1 oxidoreductase [Flavisolibacter tropicus]